jgi:hypothetical protein
MAQINIAPAFYRLPATTTAQTQGLSFALSRPCFFYYSSIQPTASELNAEAAGMRV